MKPVLRLLLTGLIILFSSAYAVLIAKDPHFASDISAVYIAGILTILTLVNVWKKS